MSSLTVADLPSARSKRLPGEVLDLREVSALDERSLARDLLEHAHGVGVGRPRERAEDLPGEREVLARAVEASKPRSSAAAVPSPGEWPSERTAVTATSSAGSLRSSAEDAHAERGGRGRERLGDLLSRAFVGPTGKCDERIARVQVGFLREAERHRAGLEPRDFGREGHEQADESASEQPLGHLETATLPLVDRCRDEPRLRGLVDTPRGSTRRA